MTFNSDLFSDGDSVLIGQEDKLLKRTVPAEVKFHPNLNVPQQ